METAATLSNNSRISTAAQWIFFLLCTSIASYSMHHLLTERVFVRSAESYREEGDKHLESSKYKRAIKAYQHSLKIKPDNLYAWHELGRAYNRLKRYNEAITAYKRSIAIAPQYHQPYHNIGSTYIKLGQYTEAVHWLEKALQHDTGEDTEYVQTKLDQAKLLLKEQSER